MVLGYHGPSMIHMSQFPLSISRMFLTFLFSQGQTLLCRSAPLKVLFLRNSLTEETWNPDTLARHNSSDFTESLQLGAIDNILGSVIFVANRNFSERIRIREVCRFCIGSDMCS